MLILEALQRNPTDGSLRLWSGIGRLPRQQSLVHFNLEKQFMLDVQICEHEYYLYSMIEISISISVCLYVCMHACMYAQVGRPIGRLVDR